MERPSGAASEPSFGFEFWAHLPENGRHCGLGKYFVSNLCVWSGNLATSFLKKVLEKRSSDSGPAIDDQWLYKQTEQG